MKKIRVTIQQPALPKFRIPFFKLLAEQDNIDLSLYYSSVDSTLPNEVADGFKAKYVAMNKLQFLRNHPILWHSPQWTFATKSKSDVLVLSWDLHYVSLLPAILKAKLNKVPILLWGHGYSKNENLIRKYLRHKVAKLASSVVFYDYHTAKSYINSGFDKDKIFVAPNSLDQLNIYLAKKYWRDNIEDLTKFQNNQRINPLKTIIYIGRVYSGNRLDILINALSEIKKEHSDVKLIIVGKGDDEELILKTIAHSLDLDKNIIWVGALYDEMEIAKWMLSATVFCYPENIGLSIMHAFGYELPVITSNKVSGHNPEIHSFKEQKNGMSYKSGSFQSLSQVIISILKNPEQISTLSREALKTVEETYNTEMMVQGFKTAIEYAHYKSKLI